MTVTLDARDQLSCNGTLLTTAQLTQEVMDFVSADPREHVISIQADRQTTYEAYYRMQNAIVAAYQSLRSEYAKQRFGLPLEQLTPEQRDSVILHVPQRISEGEPEE
jgi:hypothetical protein